MKPFLGSLIAIAVFIAPALGFAAPSRNTPNSADLNLAKMSIGNFQIVKNGEIYRGSEPDEQGIEALAGLGVKTIINLQGGDIHGSNPLLNVIAYLAEPGERTSNINQEIETSERFGIEMIQQPLNSMDHVSRDDAKMIEQIVDLVNLRKSESLFIHCAHGRDRTGLIIALYRIKYEGFSPEAAFEEMRKLGHRGFVNHLVTGNLDKFYWKAAPLYAAKYQRSQR